MKDCYLKARAYVDWLELKEEIDGQGWELRTLCNKIGGFNLDEQQRFFDYNYKSICVTVRDIDERDCYVDKYIEIWDDTGSLVDTCDANELSKYIVEDEE